MPSQACPSWYWATKSTSLRYHVSLISHITLLRMLSMLAASAYNCAIDIMRTFTALLLYHHRGILQHHSAPQPACHLPASAGVAREPQFFTVTLHLNCGQPCAGGIRGRTQIRFRAASLHDREGQAGFQFRFQCPTCRGVHVLCGAFFLAEQA